MPIADYKKLINLDDIIWVHVPGRISENVRKEALCQLAELINSENDGYGFTRPQWDYNRDVMAETRTFLPPWSLDDPDENTTDLVFGGLSLVNTRGKIAKRIRANLRKNYGIKVSPKVVAAIGAFINENAIPANTWGFRLTDDISNNIGLFGDEESCFQADGCHSVHGHAIEDERSVVMMCVYDADGKRYARAWVYIAWDGALVFFNAYSKSYLGQLRTRQIASLVATHLGLQTRKVDYETNIYQNHHWAIAVGGERSSYGFELEALYERYCGWCEEYVNHETTWIESEEQHICDDCLQEDFCFCEHCQEYARWDTSVSDGNFVVCEYCFNEYYFYCNDCEYITYYADACDYEDVSYCNDCYNDMVKESEEAEDE